VRPADYAHAPGQKLFTTKVLSKIAHYPRCLRTFTLGLNFAFTITSLHPAKFVWKQKKLRNW